jgi:hypothetical protein
MKFAAAPFLIFSCAALAGCYASEQTNNEATTQNVAAPAENIAAAVPLPQPPMDRAALLEAVASARSATAAGVDDRQVQQPLDGKEFELRIRFGCGGPAPTANALPLGWSLDQKGGVLRVHATPNLSKDDPAVAAMALQDIEAVEGFWLERPWLLHAGCPAAPATQPAGVQTSGPPTVEKPKVPPVPQALPAVPKVGIAQFFTATDPRTGRRDHRPYEAVKKLDQPSAAIGQQGFDLVLSGRLRASDGRVIRCVARNPNAPPACVIAATFDHVWIEDAASKERIADWGSS